MKFFFVYPRFKYPTGDPPIGPLCLMAYVRQELPDIQLKFFDATFQPSFKKIEDIFQEFRPEITGIYCNTLMYEDVLRIARDAKKAGSFVIVGGPHATVRPDTLICLKNVDAVVIGEGERPLVHALKCFPDLERMKENPAILLKAMPWSENDCRLDLVPDLDSLPIPAYDLIDMKKYMQSWFQLDVVSPRLMGTNVLASRGCPFHCNFCQPTLDRLFGKKIRIRSPENVITEIKFLKKRYGITSFIFADDTPTFFKEWMIKFSNLLLVEKLDMTWGCNSRVGLLDEETMRIMKKSGFRRLMVGVESGSQRILDEIYKKGIKLSAVPGFFIMAKNVGLKIFAYFMIGAPTETEAEIKQTIDLSFTLPIDEATFSITTPLPGTELETYMKEQGFDITRNFQDYDYYSSASFSQSFSPFKIKMHQRKAFLKFYLHPRRWKFLFNAVNSKNGMQKSYLKLKRLVNL